MKHYPSLAFVAAAAALATGTRSNADTFFSLDQANEPAPYQNYNIGSLSPIGQTFIPALDRLNRVDLRIADAALSIDSGAQFRVRIRQNSVTGTVRGESQTVLVPDGTGGYVTFDFASEVLVNPGFLHALEIVKLSSDAGTSNYMLTSGNGNTYAKGSPSANGVTPLGDFLFRTGLTQENRLDLTPSVQGAVLQPLPSGSRQLLTSAFIDLIEPDGNPSTTDRETKAVVEYDLSQLVGLSDLQITSATITGEVAANNSLDTGLRSVNIEFFDADLALTTEDFDLDAELLETVGYAPSSSSGATFDIDVTEQIQALLEAGGSAAGFRFDPVNAQPPSGLSSHTPPILTITLAEVPEPASLALLGVGGAVALGRRRRSDTTR